MKKYTFIVEYRKGTYIQQIVSQNLEESVIQWVQNLENFNIPNLGIKEKMSLEKNFHQLKLKKSKMFGAYLLALEEVIF